MLLFQSETWVVTPRMGKALERDSYPGDKTIDETAPAENTGQEVDIHVGDDGKGGCRVFYDGGIHTAAPEHGHTVHHYTITVRPV